MRENHTGMIPVSCFVVCCVIFSVAHSFGSEPKAKQLSPGEQKEYGLVQKRFGDPVNKNLMSAALNTLYHCANEKEVLSLEKTLTLLGTLADSSKMSELAESGGIKRLKDNVAKLLKNKDPVVRGFGAIVLAVIGDATYKSEIAKLLEEKRWKSTESEDRMLENWDRSRAAMALGLMGAKEYVPKLSTLLLSADADDRAGAARGLGYMSAKEYSNKIAKLLDDDQEQVQMAALDVLGDFNAKEYSRKIASLLETIGRSDVKKTACYTLARLNANQEVKEMAKLLNERFLKGDAAKALALIGAKEYNEKIAQLIEDEDPLVRCDALIATGILDEKEYAKKIAAHLQDEVEFVRAYAAVALLLIGDRKYSKQVVDVIQSEWKLPEIVSDGSDTATYFGVRIKLHHMFAERHNQLTMRALKAWEHISKLEN